jgi:hypothetical protein
MSVEDVLKIVTLVLIPSIGAVVWLLSQVYGLRGDLRELQTEARQNLEKISQLESTVHRLAHSVNELTIILARNGLDSDERKKN